MSVNSNSSGVIVLLVGEGFGVLNKPEPPIEGRARSRDVGRVGGGGAGGGSSSIKFLM